MIDLRVWRIALLAVALAVTVAMFSLQEVPAPRQPELAPDAYDGEAAASLARELAQSSPNPRPGSDADESLAQLVQARFQAIEGVQAGEQDFEVDGKQLRNLIAVLPGQSDRQIALIAHRDVGSGTGAATSIASTAALLEIAGDFSGSTHRTTLVFVSTDGGSLGAAGARRFIADYPDADRLDGAVVLSQPASPQPTAPLVIPWSDGPQSTGIELAETANSVVSQEVGQPAGNEGPLQDLFRLALPAGLGEQGPLIESGLDTVRISSSGELPPPPVEDTTAEVSPGSIDRFGRAAFALMLALDAAPSPLEHGPSAYVGVAGNLLPGWAISLVALALLLCVGLAGAWGIGSSARSPLEAGRSLAWALGRAVPFLAALLAVYLLDFVGVIPDPPFPFDPTQESLGVGGRIGALVTLGVLGAAFFFLRPLRPPGPRAAAAAAPAAVTLAATVVLLIWLLNPYLALLLAIGLNLWMFAALPAIPGRLAAAGLVVLGLAPLALALGDLAGRLHEGLDLLPHLLLLVTDGQIGFPMALLCCLLAGSAAAIVALAGPVPSAPAPEIRVLRRLRRGGTDREDDREAAEEATGAEPEAPPEPEPDPSVYW